MTNAIIPSILEYSPTQLQEAYQNPTPSALLHLSSIFKQQNNPSSPSLLFPPAMPEPITMSILAFLAHKKMAAAGLKAAAASSHALTAGTVAAVSQTVGGYFAAHAALVTAVAGTTALSAVLMGIAAKLARIVEAGVRTKQEAKRIMEGAKRLSEVQQVRLGGDLDNLLASYEL